jgi:hypothetical protein
MDPPFIEDALIMILSMISPYGAKTYPQLNRDIRRSSDSQFHPDLMFEMVFRRGYFIGQSGMTPEILLKGTVSA